MAGTVLVEWQGRQVEAANPDPIATATFDLSTPTVRRTEQAAAAVRAVGHRTSGGLEVTARLLLRAEGLASSAIEGIRAGAAEVALAEASGSDEEPDDHYDVASWVADNLAVVTDALSGSGTIDREHLWAWHRRLMRNAPRIDATHIGAWRDRLGWVGGPNPLLAAHVAVPAHAIDSLVLDLTAFCRRDDLDAVTHAAVAHAQFETIHPFADGNGRIGRILVGVLLARRLDVRYPPPVSLEIARDIGGYQSGLTLYRQGAIDVWVSWFADAVARAARRTSSVLDAVIALQQEWTAATAGLRADSAARRLLPLLPAHPVLNAAAVASLLGVSTEAGRLALDALADAGVVDEVSGTRRRRGRPSRWWAAADLLDLIGAG